MKNQPASGPAVEMTNCLGARVRILNRMVTKAYEDALRPFGVRVSQLNILVIVAAHGPLRGADVAQLLRLDASTLSRDLDRILENGWISASAGGGRTRMLEITPTGAKLLRSVAPAWRDAQAEAERLLTPAVAAGVTRVVDRLWAQ